MARALVQTNQRYGALHSGFSFELESGYLVLAGPNNSGKSSLLQLVFASLFAHAEYGPEKIVLLVPERTFAQPSTETGGRSLNAFNNEFLNQNGLQSAPVAYDNIRGPNPGELARLLLNHTDYLSQVERLNTFLTRLGFSKLVLKTAQLAHFDDVPIPLQGTGLRSLFTILCALTDPEIAAIIIDEPELSLEPSLQRGVRDLLIEQARDRSILVATHSHLFMNRASMSSNYLVRSEGEIVSVSPVGSMEVMQDLVFRLLGNSTMDLFFPGNYLVVEGASDQILSERILLLLGHPQGRVKVLSAQGIGRVQRVVQSVIDSLIPLVVNDSPYAKTVVALVDSPPEGEAKRVKELRELLGDRLVVLPAPSLEEYLPDALFLKAGREKHQDIEEIGRLKKAGESVELRRFKRLISEQISSVLDEHALTSIEVLTDAVTRAADLAIRRDS